jgi:tetratricopeptide (TPR) repeat protein
MSDTRKITVVLQEAALAATAGDYLAAERCLREAATLQERSLGPGHPDLANTLNNVGVVCDRLGKPDEAELCYRRAFVIATAALDPAHEFVATSRKNLQDFYTAHGRHQDAAALALSAGARRGPRLEGTSPTAAPRAARQDAAAAPRLAGRRRLAVGGALGVLAVATIAIGGRVVWPGPSDALREHAERTLERLPGAPERTLAAGPGVDPRQESAATAAAAAARASVPVEATPVIAEAAPPPAPAVLARDTHVADADVPRLTTMDRQRNEALEVATAQLCTTLEQWRCEPAHESTNDRTLFFYTRVRTPASTTVQHRWFLGADLKRSIDLRIGSSPNEGYRTYSRQRVGRDETGDWRVELRSPNGTLLHEEHVVVR